MDIQNLKCKQVLHYFEQINKIPRGSGNEKEISDYLVAFAKERNLWVSQDKAFNVIIKKDATLGYENAPAIIIQGHMDMVCEKNADIVHDFEKDPIKVIYEGDFIHAGGTTLGADDGIAVAMALAILDSDDISHPKLEIVITTDEEVGMVGAMAIDETQLDARLLINIDSDDEGIFTVGCAGGMKTTSTLPIDYQEISGLESFNLCVRGLKGGHSGIDIIKERANANKLLARALTEIRKTVEISVSEIKGGAKDNAIPREADAIINVKPCDVNRLKSEVKKLHETFISEYSMQEEKIFLICETTTKPQTKAFTDESLEKVITTINLMPNGVLNMNLEIGMPESSNNVGVVRTSASDNNVEITCAIRSSVVSKKYFIFDMVEGLVKLAGGNTIYRGNYPAWEYNPKSYLREIFIEKYKEMFKVEPAVETIHAGLECGLFAEKLKGVDMISFGPNLYDIHTPDERASISSIDRQWSFLLKVLADIKE